MPPPCRHAIADDIFATRCYIADITLEAVRLPLRCRRYYAAAATIDAMIIERCAAATL